MIATVNSYDTEPVGVRTGVRRFVGVARDAAGHEVYRTAAQRSRHDAVVALGAWQKIGNTTMTRGQATAAMAEIEAAIAANKDTMHDAWLDSHNALKIIMEGHANRGQGIYLSSCDRLRIDRALTAATTAEAHDDELQRQHERLFRAWEIAPDREEEAP